MATITLTRGTTLGSSASQADFHNLVDTATAAISGIVNADVDASAAIADSKLATITTAGKVNTSALTTTSQAAGDILYNNGTGWVRLAKGTALQQLRINAGETAPEWAAGVSFASAAEVLTGTEAAKAVAPSTLVSHQGVIKAWATFNGTGTPAYIDSFNCATGTAITDNGTGDYTLAWDTDFGNANYAVAGSFLYDVAYGGGMTYREKTAGTLRVVCGDNGGNPVDSASVSIIAIGDR